MAKKDVTKLTKKELVQLVKGNLKSIMVDEEGKPTIKVTNSLAEGALDAVADSIVEGLEGGNHVGIYGFGSFELRERAGRTGRNPQTGDEIEIPATTGVGFNPATSLKQAVRG